MRFLAAMTMIISFLPFLALGQDSSPPATPTPEPPAPQATLKAQAEALPDFSHDTGLQPASSPVQVQLKLVAKGGPRVEVVALQKEGLIAPKAGSGNLALDLHFQLIGRLKVESAVKKYDGDIPAVKSIDIGVGGSVPFEPFLLEDKATATLTSKVPETRLPSVPLGTIPGSLTLTVSEGSEVVTTFHGLCVASTAGKVRYAGQATTTGKLVLKGQILPSLPKPLNKPIDLTRFEVALPTTTVPLQSAEIELAGVTPQKLGPCP